MNPLTTYSTFTRAIEAILNQFYNEAKEVDTGHWQGVPTEGKPDLVTLELLDVQFTVPLVRWEIRDNPPLSHLIPVLRMDIQPSLPWADDHFEERVSRVPSNPGEAYKSWPWWQGQEPEAMVALDGEGKVFTHTYQERFWPKGAGNIGAMQQHMGIRYTYGDLDDLVNLLLHHPHTRQAYLPIFFPEDTGAVHGGRVPCTLGYHFMLRDGQLHMWYTIRSCDLVRHFRDDLYLAARLQLWVIEEWRSRMDNDTAIDDIRPGLFHFHCFSLHRHKGDQHVSLSR